MPYKNKKNLSKILLITILLSFTITLAGCNWLSFGLLNIFDPQAQIRVNYTEIDLETGTIDLEIYSINEVEFIGTGFEYKYYVGTTKINELSRTVGATFYVAPSTTPGTPGDITTIDNLPLYFQEVQDYITSNPLITELTCTINLIGTDGAGHSISKAVTVDLPAIQPGVDFEPPVAVINVTPGTTGTEPFTVIFDAYGSTDDRGIASYAWDFGDGTTGTGVMPAAHTYTNGIYIVKLTVTDYFGNVGVALETITVGEAGAPTAVINVTPSTTGIAPFTVYFDASQSSGSSSIVSYSWNFGDGTAIGTGMTINHPFTNPGNYTVVLTVTDSNGNQGFDSVTIVVKEAGVPAEITLEKITTPNGCGNSQIIATVKDAVGAPVPDGTVVIFSTTKGTLSSYSETTVSGIATTVLTLNTDDTAVVTALSGSVSKSVTITCTPPAP